MLPSSRTVRDRGGFTLLEILVALVLIGLLAGALVPSVISQVGKGETNRIVEDLRSVESAAQAFRVDVRRWPGDVEDLFTRPVTTGTGADTPLVGSYSATLVASWQGPYLERGTPGATGLATASGGTIVNAFAGTGSQLVVSVSGLDIEQIQAVNAAVDGVDEATAADVGQIRWTAATTPLVLRYHGTGLR